jgi:hypothetical protein
VQDGDQQMITVVGYEATEQGEDYWILNWRTVWVQNGGKRVLEHEALCWKLRAWPLRHTNRHWVPNTPQALVTRTML